MSRSYKKTPYAGQKKSKFAKNYSNRKIRQTENQRVKIADGSAFKKVYEPWNICDYYSIETWNEFKQNIEKDFIAYHSNNIGFGSYRWRYYCQHYKLDRNKLDWKKLRWVWYQMYKNK